MNSKFDLLPRDCISQVLRFTSPVDACRSSAVCSSLRDAADSDAVWESFLPPDYREIITRLVTPLSFVSKKEAFLALSRPLLIDGGTKSFSIDRDTSKKCFMISAKELNIAWASNSLYWCWKPFLHSRFNQVVELVMVSWLEIEGKINTRMLTPNTTYGAYLVVRFAGRAFGLDSMPSEVSVEVAGSQRRSEGTTYLRSGDHGPRKQTLERAFMLNRVEALTSRVTKGEERVLREWKWEDGWMEVELGEFYAGDVDGNGDGKEVRMTLREVKGEHLKGGLIVNGIDIRPKIT